MIAYKTQYLGVFQLPNGMPVHVRKRLTGWTNGIQFWVHDWKKTGWFSWFYQWQYSGSDEQWLARFEDAHPHWQERDLAGNPGAYE